MRKHTSEIKPITGIILFLLMLATASAPADAAYPLVRNFTRQDYGGGAQNWAVAQDNLGRMYFGNRDGMLMFDSNAWTMTMIDNYSTVRAMAHDSAAGRFYVGASDEIGYFESDAANGRLSYHSLKPTIVGDNRRFNEIWNVYVSGKNVWFQGDYEIFKYDGRQTRRIHAGKKITTSAMINGRLYAAILDEGLATVSGERLNRIDDKGALDGKRVCAILPKGKQLLIVTEYDGVWAYDGRDMDRMATPIDGFLRDNQVFCAIADDQKIVFGTVSDGAAIYDPSTGMTTYINKDTGLQNNTVLSMGFDNRDNLWLGLDNGIALVMSNSPLQSLLSSDSSYGAGYVSALRDGKLYLGTNQGLYVRPYPLEPSPTPPALTKTLSGQVWYISECKGTLFVGDDAGIHYLDGGEFRKIDGIPGTWSVKEMRSVPDELLASTYDGFYFIRKSGNRWISAGRAQGYDDIGGRFVEDDSGNIWIAHWLKGVYKLRLDPAARRFESVVLLDSAKGLPTNKNNIVDRHNGKIVFSTEGGFYDYDPVSGTAFQNKDINEALGYPHSARLYNTPWNDIWSVTPDDVLRASYSSDGIINVDTTTYQPIADKIIAGNDHFNFISPDKMIVAIQDGFYEVDIARDDAPEEKSPIFISHIYANQDSLIYSASDSEPSEDLRVPYELNSLKFEFVSPEYRTSKGVRYSYRLSNYDQEWSSYSTENQKEYTQLREGTYTLNVRARNTYNGTTSEGEFTFTIEAPWYRSTIAKFIYMVLTAAFLLIVWRMMKRVSRRAAQAVEERKERELAEMKQKSQEEAMRKDYEIAHLRSEQLEHDIRHKSQELSNTTLNVIRKNEILQEISDRIARLQQASDSQSTAGKQLAKIQSLINDNISHDDDWRNFTHNFDVVYENFTKRLLELHPNLNGSDQRLCCYLKMGLSSKEIAPLFNISYRSVEMSRYRLRKKMGLSREVNLADYLQRL